MDKTGVRYKILLSVGLFLLLCGCATAKGLKEGFVDDSKNLYKGVSKGAQVIGKGISKGADFTFSKAAQALHTTKDVTLKAVGKTVQLTSKSGKALSKSGKTCWQAILKTDQWMQKNLW